MGVAVVEVNALPRTVSNCNPDSPARFSSWGVKQIILRPETPTTPRTSSCTEMEPHCILSVSVEQVKAAVDKLLKQTRTESFN